MYQNLKQPKCLTDVFLPSSREPHCWKKEELCCFVKWDIKSTKPTYLRKDVASLRSWISYVVPSGGWEQLKPKVFFDFMDHWLCFRCGWGSDFALFWFFFVLFFAGRYSRDKYSHDHVPNKSSCKTLCFQMWQAANLSLPWRRPFDVLNHSAS